MDAMLAATAEAEDRHFWFRGLRRTAEQLLGETVTQRPLSRIIDCGSGTGRNLDWLREWGPAVGVELSPTGLAVAQRFHRPVVRGSVTHLPFPDTCADLVTSFDVLYCLPGEAERRAVAEMARVLRPGGVALVNVAALDLLRGSHSTLTHEQRRYTPATLRAALTSGGLRVERLTFTNCLTFPLVLAARAADRIRGRAHVPSTRDLGVPAAPINTALDVVMRVEAGLLRLTNLPVGSSLMAVARKPPHSR